MNHLIQHKPTRNEQQDGSDTGVVLYEALTIHKAPFTDDSSVQNGEEVPAEVKKKPAKKGLRSLLKKGGKGALAKNTNKIKRQETARRASLAGDLHAEQALELELMAESERDKKALERKKALIAKLSQQPTSATQRLRETGEDLSQSVHSACTTDHHAVPLVDTSSTWHRVTAVPELAIAPMKQGKKKKKEHVEWSLKVSVWNARPGECESKDFYDQDNICRKAFLTDFKRVNSKMGFTNMLSKAVKESVQLQNLRAAQFESGKLQFEEEQMRKLEEARLKALEEDDDEGYEQSKVDVEALRRKRKQKKEEERNERGAKGAAKAMVLLGSGGDEAVYMNELREVREEIWDRYEIISNCFDYYAAISGGSGVMMKLNSFNVFLDECHIPESPAPGSKRTPLCNQSALDTIFQVVNLEEGDSRAEENALNDDKALTRFEFLEAIVRIAFKKFLNPELQSEEAKRHKKRLVEDEGVPDHEAKKLALEAVTRYTDDPSTAVDKLTEEHMMKFLPKETYQERDTFRIKRMYTEECCKVIRPHKRILMVLFSSMCKEFKYESKIPRLSMTEWMYFLSSHSFFDHSFTKREGRLIFVWSKMRVSDEMTSRLQMVSMTFTDFLEGLCRVADMKALPSDEQINEWKAECVEKAQNGVIDKPQNILGYFNDLQEDEKLMLCKSDATGGGIDGKRTIQERVEKLLKLILCALDADGDGDVDEADLKKLGAHR
jgi:hypothetical protein